MVKVIEMTDPKADALIARQFGRTPLLVQLPTVFALVAPATRQGARLLDRCKKRLPGKHYGVLVGELSRFLGLSTGTVLTDYVLNPARSGRLRQFEEDLSGTFLRTPVNHPLRPSKMICDGTIQGLLTDGVLQEKMRLMEALTAHLPDKLLGAEHGHYCAPIASSCNISGHPEGSITDFETALAFARNRGVKLMLTHGPTGEAGSNPILGVAGDRVETFRDGPGVNRKRRVLEGWLDHALAEASDLALPLNRSEAMMDPLAVAQMG